MAWNAELIGTVTKRTLEDNGFEYLFVRVVITTNTTTNTMEVRPNYGARPYTVVFTEITEKHSTTDIEGYVDHLATNNFFQ